MDIQPIQPIEQATQTTPVQRVAQKQEAPTPATAPTVDTYRGEEQSVDISEEMIQKSIDQANASLAQYNRQINRSIHETTKAFMFQVIDTENDKIIREFPAQKIQDMIAKMWELAGLVVDERV